MAAIALLAALAFGGCDTAETPPEPKLPEGGRRPGSGERDVRPAAALEAPDPQVRAAGIELLLRTKGAARPEILRPMLADPAAVVRAAAVDALRQVGGGSADLRAVGPLLADTDAGVRAEVVRFLAGRDGQASLPVLRRVFQEDTDSRVRALALVSLGVLDESGADLTEALALHQRGATVGEGSISDEERSAAKSYLCVHAGKLGTAMLATLVPLLADPDATVRVSAARALGERGGPGAAEPLAVAFRREQDATAAAVMLQAHVQAGGTALHADCLRLLASPNHWMVQSAATIALGRDGLSGTDNSAEVLAEVLADGGQDSRVRQTAAVSLGRIGRVDLLDAACASADAGQRRAALASYPPGDAARVLEVARQLANDPDGEVRWLAIVVRSRLRDRTAYPELVDGLRHSMSHAGDALTVLKEITGGKPDHGLDHKAWRRWLTTQR